MVDEDMSITTFLKSKKNRAFLFFLLGVLCIYFYTKNKAKAAELKEWDGGYLGSLRDVDGASNGRVNGENTTPVVPYTPPAPPTGGTNGDEQYLGDVIVTSTITPKLYFQGWEPHCEVRITGTSGEWRLKDHGTEALPAGHVWRYGINGHVFHSATRLDAYVYPCDENLSVWVTPVKNDKQNVELHYWGGEGWQDPALSAGFSQNVSFGFSYYIFNRAAA